MRKTLCLLMSFVLFASAFTASAATASNGSVMNWFFRPSTDGEQPEVMGGSTLPDEYGALYLGSRNEKVIYLTFDAGYENGNVEKVLDVLRSHSAVGAFFILPNIIRTNTSLVNRMFDEGHTVCNHSYSHRNMGKISSYDEFIKEINGVERVCLEYTGKEMSKYFRPPEGAFSEKTLSFCRDAGVVPVFWSFAYADWDNNAQKDAEWAYDRIMSSVHNGEVMLLHPTSSTNAAILDRVLTSLEEQGYRFGSLDELYLYSRTGKQLPASKETDEINYYKKQGMVFCENPSAGKCVALTFDDGPHPTLTDEILDILDEYGVKATFFAIGKNASENPGPVRRAIEAGHEIGNHTYSHLLLGKCSEEAYLADVEKAEKLFEEEFSYRPRLFRPPGGRFAAETVEKLCSKGYKYVLWAWRLDTRDWACPSVNDVVDTVMKNVRGGDIILFHDYNSRPSPTPEALRTIIPSLREQGYTFVTVSELFGE